MISADTGLLTFGAWQPLERQRSSGRRGGVYPDPAAVLAVYMRPETHQPLGHCLYLPPPAHAIMCIAARYNPLLHADDGLCMTTAQGWNHLHTAPQA